MPTNEETQEVRVQSLGQEDPLEEEMATNSMENSVDGEAWRSIIHGVTKSLTRLVVYTYTCITMGLVTFLKTEHVNILMKIIGNIILLMKIFYKVKIT